MSVLLRAVALFAVLLLFGRGAAAQSHVAFEPSTPTSTQPTTMLVRLPATPDLRIASYAIERSGFTIVVRALTFEPVPPGAESLTVIPLGQLTAGSYRLFLDLDFDIGVPSPPELFVFQVDASGIPAASPGALALLAALVLAIGTATLALRARG